MAGALVVMIGWLSGNKTLPSLFPSLPTMKFNAALCFALLGATLLMDIHAWRCGTRRWLLIACAGVAVLIASGTIIELLTSLSFELDELFVLDPESHIAGRAPGRMSMATAVSILLLAASLILGANKRTSQFLAAGAGLLGVAALGMYFVDSDLLLGMSFFSTMSIPTASLVAMVAVGRLLFAYQIMEEAGAGADTPLSDIRTNRLHVYMSVFAILVGGLLITAWTTYAFSSDYYSKEHLRYTKMTELLRVDTERRANQVVYGLMGARGVFAASKSVERLEFRSYVDSRDLAREFPGAIGMGFIERVMRDDIDDYLARQRADDAPNFQIKTTGDADDLYVISYIDPLDRNLQAWGYDVGSETVRRSAVEHAVRTGQPTMTGHITLVQDQKKLAGFLYLVPVYRNDTNPRTPRERVETLVGLVYSAIIADEVFAGIMDSADGLVDIEVFDGEHTTSENKIYDADKHLNGTVGVIDRSYYKGRMFTSEHPIKVGGRTWTLRFSTTPAFKTSKSYSLVPLTCIAGMLLTLLLAGLVRSYGLAQSRAIRLAMAMTEDLAEAKTRAESATRSKSEFLANMSHEIRTPLAAIIGYADLLRCDPQVAESETRRNETIDTICNAGHHLLLLINDVLDLSKIEASRMTIEAIDTSPVQIIGEVVSLMSPQAKAKGIELKVRLTTPVPHRMISDPTRLRQVMMNLVGNATKFTDRGYVEIEAGVNQTPAGPRLRLAVRDTGPGISPEQAANLFQPFIQVDNSITRRHGGTGLGLTICRRLAKLMGGQVLLEPSEPGQGACFVFEIPASMPEDAVMINDLSAITCDLDVLTNAVDDSVPTLSGRVLLAEDGLDNQRLINHHLQRAGVQVDIAENGRIALEMLETARSNGQPYNLLLTDMQMPEMDGYTLAKHLRDHGWSIPIIALTAHAMAEDRAKCLEAGCSDYASKPIDRVAFIRLCAKWLGGSNGTPGEAPLFVKSEEAVDRNSGHVLVSDLAGDQVFADLLMAYTDRLKDKAADLRSLLASEKHDDLALLAHRLAGSGAGYGYPAISEAAGELEQQVRGQAPIGQLKATVDELAALCERAHRGRVTVDSPVRGADQVDSKNE